MRHWRSRYQSAKELEVDLRRLAMPSSATAAAVTPAGSAWRKAVSPASYGVAGLLVLAALLVALNVGGWRSRLVGRAPSARIESLAVLPLENFSRDAEQEYFADGMTEALITDLAKIGALRVISRTSVMQYKGVKKPLPDIAKALNVDAVVEGSVQRSGNRVRITAQLIQAATDRHLWAESYERDLSNVLALQDEVAKAIASEIKVTLTPQEKVQLTSARPVNPEAHEAYLKGRYALNRATSEKDVHTAIAFFQQAIAKDPRYAPAYAGLSDGYRGLVDLYVAPREVMPQARAAAMKALELDEMLAEAHNSLGFVRFIFDWDWTAVEREFNRAIELNPGLASAYDGLANLYTSLGRGAEATTAVKRAQRLDPLSFGFYVDEAWFAFNAREYQRAIESSQKALELAPNSGDAQAFLGLAYAAKGQFADAVALSEEGRKTVDSPLDMLTFAYIFAVSGKRQEAEKLLHDVKEMGKQRYICPYEIGAVYLGLGDKEEALKWLWKGYEGRSLCMVWTKVDSRLDPLRSDPRFQDLLRRIGLPP